MSATVFVFSRISSSFLTVAAILAVAGSARAADEAPPATPEAAAPSAPAAESPAPPDTQATPPDAASAPAGTPAAPASPAPAPPAPAEKVPAPPVPPVVVPVAAAEAFVAPKSRVGIAENKMGPVHLQWRALGAVDLPGLVSVRLGTEVYLPGLPIYLAGQFVKSWGLDLDTVQFDPSVLWEVRAGLSFSSWGIVKLDERFTTESSSEGSFSQTRTRSGFVDVGMRRPQFDRVTPFVGLRNRKPSTADGMSYLTAGISWMTSEKAVGHVRELGEKEMSGTTTVDLQLLFAANSERDMIRRVGADLTLKYSTNGLLAVSMGLGWDGEVVLFHSGIGFGGTHSFGAVPPSSEMKSRD